MSLKCRYYWINGSTDDKLVRYAAGNGSFYQFFQHGDDDFRKKHKGNAITDREIPLWHNQYDIAVILGDTRLFGDARLYGGYISWPLIKYQSIWKDKLSELRKIAYFRVLHVFTPVQKHWLLHYCKVRLKKVPWWSRSCRSCWFMIKRYLRMREWHLHVTNIVGDDFKIDKGGVNERLSIGRRLATRYVLL